MAFNLLFWDKNSEEGITGTFLTQSVLGELIPSYTVKERQFLRPISDNALGFVFKGGTYVSISLNGSNYIFGSGTDVTFASVIELLDTGIAMVKGRDYYVYLCLIEPAGEQKLYTAELKVSLNSTYPEGYNENNSRKIGGFHTCCSNKGEIADHPLSGWQEGWILPYSFWDLSHRPTCNSEGMVYIKEMDCWVDIYLQSGTGTSTVSVFGGTITKSQTQSQHVEDMFLVGKKPLDDPEFACMAEGSNQQTNIQGGADPVTTGAHVDTAGRPMVSNYGVEDCCGAYWQWLREIFFGSNQAASWVQDPSNKGQQYQVNGLLAGGAWDSAAGCGSRARYACHSRLDVVAHIGCRGRAPSRSC